MHIHIHTLALNDLLGQRLRLASNLLAAYSMEVDIDPWRGAPCDLLVATPDDPLSRRSLDIAQQRGINILVLGNPNEFPQYACAPRDAQVTSIAQLIRKTLAKTSGQLSGELADTSVGLHVLLDARWRGKSVDVHYKDHVACIRPDRGRVFAHSRSELDKIRLALAQEGPQAFTVRASDSATINMASTSLEAFLLVCAHESCTPLPELDGHRYKLTSWPDLGSIPQVQKAMQISARLVLLKMSFEELAASAGDTDDLHTIKACLWAFLASGLVSVEETRDVPAPGDASPAAAAGPARPQAGIWASIARTFGMTH